VPDLVLCSPAKRAHETLEGIVPALGEAPEVIVDAELYGAGAEHLLARLRHIAGDVQSAMLVGHNPAIHDLALELAVAGPELDRLSRKFPTGALATLGFEDAWAELGPGGAELTAFVRPRDLG
jgi:phosphohistidine phosphatase